MLILSTLVGLALNGLILQDMVQTLFTPTGGGAVSSRAVHYLWRIARQASRQHPDRLALVGPLALMLIILLWTGGLILGWACLLWPHLPDQFLLAPGMAPDRNRSFLDAVYLSTVTLATLGNGDITLQAPWLRLVAPLEAVIGFGLLTASISWIMAIDRVLGRRRHLARDVALLQRAEQDRRTTLLTLPPQAAPAMLQDLTSRVVSLRIDLGQFPISYYFWAADPASTLDVALPQLVALGRAARQHQESSVHWQGTLLMEALQDLTAHLGEQWLGCDRDASIDEVVTAYGADRMPGGRGRRVTAGDL